MLGPSYYAAVSKGDGGHNRIVKSLGVAVKGLPVGVEGGLACYQGDEEALDEKGELESLLGKDEGEQSLGRSSLHPGHSLAARTRHLCCHGLCDTSEYVHDL